MPTARKDGGRRIQATLPTNAYACLEWLAQQRRFGSTAAEVATFLVLEGIQHMMETGILPAGAMGSHEQQDAEARKAEARNHRIAGRGPTPRTEPS